MTLRSSSGVTWSPCRSDRKWSVSKSSRKETADTTVTQVSSRATEEWRVSKVDRGVKTQGRLTFAEAAGGDKRCDLVARLGRLAIGRWEGGLDGVEIVVFERLGKLAVSSGMDRVSEREARASK